jgi:glycosyltransferase involved in cell wall biosynthesis
MAYERLSLERREAFPLVLVGDVGWRNKEIHERIEKLGQGVRTFGYLRNPDDLALMYNAASIFVYPSLYEGFGIPPLEAMACGTPVCLSSIPVFHEIYGQESACYADPHDPDSLASALNCLLNNEPLRQRLTREGLQLAQRYSWDNVYEQYAELFRTLLPS